MNTTEDPQAWRARLDDFALSAELYVRWAEDTSRAWTLDEAERRLVDLLRHGLELVEEDAELEDDDDPEVTDAEWKAVLARGKEIPFDYYWCVIEPHDLDQDPRFGTGSLSDDLADTYRDVLCGLRSYRAGRFGEANHAWRLGHGSHWGQHAANAVAAIREFRFGGA